MHFQTDDEEPGSSGSTAERGEREEMLRHFVPVNMLSERTVERMGGELGYSGDASPHKSHQIPLDKTGSGSIMDPPARGATA